MSPEICNKEKYDGPATDIWASGVVLYQMLFGVQPFRASNEQELYRKIQKGVFKIPAIEDGKFELYPEIDGAPLIQDLLQDLL